MKPWLMLSLPNNGSDWLAPLLARHIPDSRYFDKEYFNPMCNWPIGCAKVSAGCANCYAERDFDKRRHVSEWGLRVLFDVGTVQICRSQLLTERCSRAPSICDR